MLASGYIIAEAAFGILLVERRARGAFSCRVGIERPLLRAQLIGCGRLGFCSFFAHRGNSLCENATQCLKGAFCVPHFTLAELRLAGFEPATYGLGILRSVANR
jgi:hypothetical protein